MAMRAQFVAANRFRIDSSWRAMWWVDTHPGGDLRLAHASARRLRILRWRGVGFLAC